MHLKDPTTTGQVLGGVLKCDRVFIIGHGKKKDGKDFVELADANLSVDLANQIGKPYGGNCTGIGCNIGNNQSSVPPSAAVQQLISELKNLLDNGGCPCEKICIYSGPANSNANKSDFATEDDLPENIQDNLNKYRQTNPPPLP